MDFAFEVIRLWQMPVEQLLASGLGTLPLAVLGKMPAGQNADEALPAVVARLLERIQTEAPSEYGSVLSTAAYVLTGIRASRERVNEMFRGVRKMRDSTTYQAILDEGRAEGEIKGRAEGEIKGRAEGEIKGREEGLTMGQVEEARQVLLRLGRKRLGPPESAVDEAVRAINDLPRLESLIERMLDVASWQDLLRTT